MVKKIYMIAAYLGPEHTRFLYASGKQFKWNDFLDGLLNLLQDEFCTKWSVAKQDDKMAVIKGTNVTVSWYKSLWLCSLLTAWRTLDSLRV